VAISAIPLGLTAMAMPAMTATAMAGAPVHRVGLASGVLNAGRQTGGAFGVAVLGALLGAGNAVSTHVAFIAIAGAYAVGIVLAAVGRATAAVPELDHRRSA
jgi:DHA2 family methylenomycin A resistance protein-like MFS transporter